MLCDYAQNYDLTSDGARLRDAATIRSQYSSSSVSSSLVIFESETRRTGFRNVRMPSYVGIRWVSWLLLYS